MCIQALPLWVAFVVDASVYTLTHATWVLFMAHDTARGFLTYVSVLVVG